MATADLTIIDDVLETRLEILKGVLGSFDFSGLSFGPINYLKHQLTEGRLRDLHFDRALEPLDFGEPSSDTPPSMRVH